MGFVDNISLVFARALKHGDYDSKLLHVLRTWQIFFIALTAVIGTGAFTDFARASATVGPAGLLVAIIIVGLIAAAFMEALSEMLQVLRTVNPLVEYVHVFVDPALAKCVAGVYWFSYASFMAVQLITAGSYLSDDESTGLTVSIFFIIVPVAIILLNLQQVYYYAWLETIFGAVKLMLTLTITMILVYVAGHGDGASNITDGVKPGKAICLVLENIAFSFLGIESIAVMSYEAKGKSALKNSSQIIAWVPLIFYLLFAVALNMCFDWRDTANLNITPYGEDTVATSSSAVLLAVQKLPHSDGLQKALKGILVFCAISAANSTLYISSRMLYGSAFNEKNRNWLRWFRSVTNSGVPKGAIIFSGVCFCVWVPYISLSNTVAAKKTVEFFSYTGSIGVLFVWGTTCLAYLRYWYWLHMYKSSLQDFATLKRYNRWNRRESSYFTPTAYFHLQPFTTAIGFLGCLFFVFVCPSAYWWGKTPTAGQLFEYYTIHLVVSVAWLSMKTYEFFNRRSEKKWWPWVRIQSNDLDALRSALESFKQFDAKFEDDESEEGLLGPARTSSARHTGRRNSAIVMAPRPPSKRGSI